MFSQSVNNTVAYSGGMKIFFIFIFLNKISNEFSPGIRRFQKNTFG